MAAVLESEAHFAKRCLEIKMTAGTLKALQTMGVATMGSMAYVVGTPGSEVSDSALRSWLDVNLPNLTVGDHAAVKRILFESQTVQLSALRQSILDPDSTTKQKLPEAEKSQRLNAFIAANPGLHLDSTMQPGHSLLELACEQERDNLFKHIPIEKRVSRQHELLNQSKPSKVLELEAGKLSVRETLATPDQPAYGALAVLEGLTRRGFAYVMARCCSLEAYQRYVSKLLQHFRRQAPTGHQRVTMEQLLQADTMVFVHVLESGCTPRAKADGSFDLDKALHTALDSYMVSSILLPLPAGTKRKHSGGKGKPVDDIKQPFQPRGQKGKEGKSSKGKGKGKIGASSVPNRIRLLGGRGLSRLGKTICFAYNLEGCQHADKCSREHICAKCDGPHPIHQCPSAKAS